MRKLFSSSDLRKRSAPPSLYLPRCLYSPRVAARQEARDARAGLARTTRSPARHLVPLRLARCPRSPPLAAPGPQRPPVLLGPRRRAPAAPAAPARRPCRARLLTDAWPCSRRHRLYATQTIEMLSLRLTYATKKHPVSYNLVRIISVALLFFLKTEVRCGGCSCRDGPGA